MRCITLLILLLAYGPCSLAQEAEQALRAAMVRMAAAKSYHATARVDLIDGNGKVISREESEAFVSGERSWTRIGTRTMVLYEREFLFVDDAEKQMVHQSRSEGNARSEAPNPAEMINDMLKLNVDRMSVHKKDEHHLTVRIKGDEEDDYAFTDIQLRRKDLGLVRITYQVHGLARDLGKGQQIDRIEVVYSRFDLNANVPDGKFSLKPYVRTGRNGNLVPAPGYEAYQLIQNSGS